MENKTLYQKIDFSGRFIELIILFFAITLGFVVENYREDLSEKKNSKQLISSLLIDLEKDLIRFEAFSKARKDLINDVYNFVDDVNQRGLLNDDLKQQKLFAKAIFNWTYFKPNTANIEQVISAGALRYLGDQNLKYQVGVLEAQNLSIIDRQEREQEYFLNYLQPLMHKYYNFKWLNAGYVKNWDSFDKASENITVINPSNKNLMFWDNSKQLENEIVNLFENYVFILRSSFFVTYNKYLEEVQNAIHIIKSGK